MTAIKLDYAVPTPDLAPFVTLFYRFQADIPLFDELERADHAQFRFRLSPGAAGYRFGAGAERPAPPTHFLAATREAIRTRAEGPVLVFGMGLTPVGWATILGLDASAALNRVIDAQAMLGAAVADTAAGLAAVADAGLPEMVAAVEPLLRSLVRRADGETVEFVRAVDEWLSDAPSPAIDRLLASTGLALRQAERRCKQYYGAPPKVLARKYRALRAATAIAAHDEFSDVIVAEGFYDQSHLIRELKQFTGRTPGQIRADPGPLAQLTIAQRRELHGVVSPIISDT